jgi:hypothetical protein
LEELTMAREASLERQRQWRDRLGRFSRSTLSVSEFCRRERVSVAAFYQWRKKLAVTAGEGQLAAPPLQATFLPVHVTAARGLQVAFPNGVPLTLPVEDHALIRLSIEAVAQARTTKARTTGEA